MHPFRPSFSLLGFAACAVVAGVRAASAQVVDPLPFNASYGGAYAVAGRGIDTLSLSTRTVSVNQDLGFSTSTGRATITYTGANSRIGGAFTLVSHDGSQVNGTFAGTIAATKLGFTSTDCTFRLAGGTGPYVHAKGSGACTIATEENVTANPVAAPSGIVAVTFAGSIEP